LLKLKVKKYLNGGAPYGIILHTAIKKCVKLTVTLKSSKCLRTVEWIEVGAGGGRVLGAEVSGGSASDLCFKKADVKK
jgi:hypothetical protein